MSDLGVVQRAQAAQEGEIAGVAKNDLPGLRTHDIAPAMSDLSTGPGDPVSAVEDDIAAPCDGGSVRVVVEINIAIDVPVGVVSPVSDLGIAP